MPNDLEPKWYIIRVVSSKEDGIIDKIKYSYDLLRKDGVEPEEFIKEFSVPKMSVFDYKNGKRIEKKVPIYPGYLFVKMILTAEIFHFLQRTLGSLNLLNKPMSDREYDAMLKKADELKKSTEDGVNFEIGQKVKIMDGTLKSMVGSVIEVHKDTRKLRLSVPIFGRNTEVDVGFSEIELES